MKKRQSNILFLYGYIAFFLLVAAIITVAVLTFSEVNAKFEGNNTAISLLMLAVVFVLAAVCTVADVIRRKFTVSKPVEKILDATDRIAEGDFSVRLDIPHRYTRYDGYDRIMENVNKMAAQLSEDKVLKTDFVSNVSHEFKTPLAVIQNYATALQNPETDAKTRKEYAATLVDASRKLGELISNILKLNRLEHQQITEVKENVRLDELLAQSVLDFEEKIESKNIELECDLEEITAFTYPGYLEIVFKNLLSNAIKFTDDGGKVTVTLARRDGKAEVKVSDTGCGISKEVGARIFDKFYQGDTSHAQEGNGLGLALVKRVVDTIGGEISVESELGKGSTFTVTVGDGI